MPRSPGTEASTTAKASLVVLRPELPGLPVEPIWNTKSSDISGWSYERSVKSFRKCFELLDVPDLMGDPWPDRVVGNVTLIQDGPVGRTARRYA